MSGNRELQSADISPPLALDANIPGPSGVYARALATSSQRYTIPDAWKGNFVTFMAQSDCEVSFGGAAVSATYGQASTLAGEVLTAVAASGFHLTAGIPYAFRVPRHSSITKFCVTGANPTSGNWSAYLSNNLISDDEV